ncbi:flagellin [Vibrio cortegadensis]|uniref:flagellin n=1 Tax=Vibrio cortegadensis TaxID=1328770 RepID=UPI00352BE372
MISLNTNTSAMITQRYFSDAASETADTQRKLNSGYRINSASDDAAGMQISNTLSTQTRGIDVSLSNASNAYSVAQTAEGALQESSDMLQRLRSLSLQSANGSNSQDDRDGIQHEASALKDELNRIAQTTTFAGKNLFNGLFGSQSFHISPNADSISLNLKNMSTNLPEMGGHYYIANESVDETWQVPKSNLSLNVKYGDVSGEKQNQQIRLKAGDSINEVATYINSQQDIVDASVTEDRKLQLFMGTLSAPKGFDISGSLNEQLDFEGGDLLTLDDLDLSSLGQSQLGVSLVDTAMKYVDSHRSEIGSFQNRVEVTIDNLHSINQNMTASKSRIKDADFARESVNQFKSQALQQATSTLLVQAKQIPSAALGLLS